MKKNIVDKLSEIHGDGIKYYTTLWYREGSITSDNIQKFLVKYEKDLHIKTKIVVDNKLHVNDFVWFDITKLEDVNHKQQIRFQYIFNGKEQLFDGLNQFHQTAQDSVCQINK